MEEMSQQMKEIGNRVGGEELLEAQAHVWNHMFNFISSMSLKCAVELGIPDIIHNHPHKPITLSELVESLKICEGKSFHVYRLMRLLVHSGTFARQKIPETQEHGYVLTPASKILLKSHCMTMTPFILAMLDPRLVTPWHFLSDWFERSDEMINPFEVANGTSVWKYCGKNQDIGKLFDESMACDASLVMNVVLKECKMKFEGLNSFVDVGGGTGTVARLIAEAFPDTKCTVLDQPQVVGSLQGSRNLEFVSGDMFESIPSADVAFLKWILHDWSDEEGVKILSRCREAIQSKENGGRVIILDMVLDGKKNDNYESTETQLFFDMLMMFLVKGKERTEIEWEKLFLDAGFSGYTTITPILGLRSFIEVFP